jgi:hypothetical protein
MDDFTGRLYEIYKQIQAEGPAQVTHGLSTFKGPLTHIDITDTDIRYASF